MKTKIILTASTVFLGSMGLLLSFLPQEIAHTFNIEPNSITLLFLKLMSALYLGFAVLNGMARHTLIGGIYNKPIAFGNLMHYGVGAIALVKVIPNINNHSEVFIALTVIYVLFTLLFVYIFKTHPTRTET